MTAEPDLLPSSVTAFTEALKGERGLLDAWLEVNDEREVAAHIEAYARANVAHATAAKDAEIEALRAEVEDYRTNGAAAVRFAPNSAYWSNELRRLFGDDARTGIEVLESQYRQELTRAERLAEALRRYGVHDQACVAANIPICTCGLDAALEQEAGRG